LNNWLVYSDTVSSVSPAHNDNVSVISSEDDTCSHSILKLKVVFLRLRNKQIT